MDSHQGLAITVMVEHVRAGRAVPLLPEGAPGPVRHRDRWWAIRVGQTHYQPVTDPRVIAQLDADAGRWHRARHAVIAAGDTGAQG